jgi:hypothetical protein
VLGTATVTQLFTQYETSSIIFASGSTKFGDTDDDTHQFTGSLSILGTATSVEGFTGSLQGNADTATSSSFATTSSFAITSSFAENIILPDGVVSSSTQTVANILGQTIEPANVNATDTVSAAHLFITNSGSIGGIDISTGLVSNNTTNLGIGNGALAKLPSGSNITGSIAIGFNAFGNASSSGATTTANNVIIGHNAYASASTVGNNTGIRNNVAIGANAMNSSATAGTVAIGAGALQRAVGAQQVAIGFNALQNLSVGIVNVAIGPFAGSGLQSGSGNTLLHNAGVGLTSGSTNVLIGQGAATALRTGSNNVILGVDTLDTIVDGNNNIALGHNAGRRVTSGSNELFINSIDRSDATGDYSSSIIYGRQSEVVSGQVLRLNAQVIAPYGITGSIESASFATTASAATSITFTPLTASFATSASFATTASIAENVSGFISFPNGLFVTGSVSASIFSGSGAGLTNISSASFATTSSFATTASAATSITFIPTTASFATTASAATSITFTPASASFATTASFAANANPFPLSGSAIITGSLTVSGSGQATASTTPVDLNGLLWSGSYNSSSIIPGAVSASDLGSQSNPFRNAYFSGFISASTFVSFSGSALPPAGPTSASFTYDASSATPVTGTSSSLSGLHDEIKACVMSSSGEVLYYLNSTNWAQKADTSAATLNAAGQHVMIEIPKFYWTASQAGTGATRTVTYNISADAATTGSPYNFELHPAFYKSGSVVEKRYISAYLACGRSGSSIVTGNGAMDTGSAANQLASISGSAPLHSRSKTSCRQLANNIGNGWGIHEIYLQNALELLYLTEYKTLNTQTALGNGNGSTSAAAGLSNAYANGSTPTGYVGSVRYRGIENLWGVNSQWIDGIVFSTTPITTYVTNDHTYFADFPSSASLANYVKVSGSIITAGGGGFWGDYYEYNSHKLSLIIPNAHGGSSTTKFTDFGYSPSNSPSGSYSMGNNGSTAGQGGWWYRECELPSRADQFYGTRIAY